MLRALILFAFVGLVQLPDPVKPDPESPRPIAAVDSVFIEDLTWTDLLGVSLLAGIGFTVSLLIGELAYGTGTERDGAAKVGIVAGSVTAAALAAIVLSRRNKVYRRLQERASRDSDADGVPDFYQPSLTGGRPI